MAAFFIEVFIALQMQQLNYSYRNCRRCTIALL